MATMVKKKAVAAKKVGSAPAKKATAKSAGAQAKKRALGKWSVVRVSDTQLTVNLPQGMVITGRQVTIDDLLSAIATSNAIEKGRTVVKCCAGNMAIA